jgi:uncharacterized protein YbjT (DUF2867 family)
MYIISGATGNTGKPISLALLKAGKKVRVVGRNKDKLNELAAKGAEVVVGDLMDRELLKKTFTGATAVYAMIPPNFMAADFRAFQNRIAESFAQAIEAAGIKFAVTLSSVGAHLPQKAGVVQGLYDMEQRFNQIKGLNVLHLRPTYFMENLFGQIGTIKQMGIMGSPVKSDLSFPLVATRDIAEVASRRLLALDFKGPGNVEYVLGPRNLSFTEIAKILGSVIGKSDLKYMEFPFAEARKAMISGWGLSESAADAMNEFMDSMNNGLVFSDSRRSAQNTTPTSLEDFSKIFAGVYQNS